MNNVVDENRVNRRYVLLLVVTVFLGLCSTVHADSRAASSANTARLAAMMLPDSLGDVGERVVTLAERGLKEAGFQIPHKAEPEKVLSAPLCAPGVPGAKGAASLGCTPSGFQSAFETMPIDVLVFGKITSTPDRFIVQIWARRGVDGLTLAESTVTCETLDPCLPVPETTRAVVREVGRKARREYADVLAFDETGPRAGAPTPPEAREPQLVSGEAMTSVAPSEGDAVETVPRETAETTTRLIASSPTLNVSEARPFYRHPAALWTGAAGALTLMTAGGIWLAINDKCQVTSCAQRYATRTGGALMLGGGVLLGATAALLHFWPRDERPQDGDLVFSAGPGTFAVSGRF